MAWGWNVKTLKRSDDVRRAGSTVGQTLRMGTIRILGVGILGDGVQVIGTIL